MTKTGHWARRKEVREQEKNRKLRIEKAGLLKRKVQIKEIEKNIQGYEKVDKKR